MPTYLYECTECNKEFEVEQSINDPALTNCSQIKDKECGNCSNCNSCPNKESCENKTNLKRLISKTSFVLIGSSWGHDNYK